MLGLTIKNLEIVANTNGGKFSANIPFESGLNIIRAENSSGKSTCINAIAYSLGIEPILGPSRKRPFPKSLYEVILNNKIEETPFFVSHSFVTITIENSKGDAAVLTRDIKGNDKRVSIEVNGETTDYFLGVSGHIGSANRERGFHVWLAAFIGWILPTVPKHEDGESLLYLECIFPLFFIEQKRGWSEIQANSPTYYGIKNLRKSAVEFCLGIDSFEYEKKISALKSKVDHAKNEWESLCSTAESIADFNSVKLTSLSDLDSKDIALNVSFNYLENDVYISVSEQEKSLKRLIGTLSADIDKRDPSDSRLDSQISVVRALRREVEKISSSIEVALLSVSEVDNKLLTLNYDYDQYQQLKRLKQVGSTMTADLGTEKCPICESDLYDTLGNRSVAREPMTLEENIEFLKNQISFFSSVKNKSLDGLSEFQAKARIINARIIKEKEKLSDIRENIDGINGAAKEILKTKFQAEHSLMNVLKLKESEDDLNAQAERIYSQWGVATGSLNTLRQGNSVGDKSLIIRDLERILKENLDAFQFNHAAIQYVSISDQTLRPEQEGYDIVAETSASDYIRIIWAYTLALMELAGENEEVKHGGFVVFDEPRQHEASKLSFARLIGRASESSSYNGQVIFATSMDAAELELSCEGKNINLTCFDDYVLTLESSE